MVFWHALKTSINDKDKPKPTSSVIAVRILSAKQTDECDSSKSDVLSALLVNRRTHRSHASGSDAVVFTVDSITGLRIFLSLRTSWIGKERRTKLIYDFYYITRVLLYSRDGGAFPLTCVKHPLEL